MKKTLVIHNADKSTDFLKPIYKGMHNKTVVTKDITTEDLKALIRSHDRIIMLGHGWTVGLFNMHTVGNGGLSINHTHVDLLKDKECIFIWCKAHVFVEQHGLKGFNTDMFISEVSEASMFGIKATQKQVDKSNNGFVEIFRKYRTLDGATIQRRVKKHYIKIANNNKVAKFNYERLYYNE